MDLIISTFGYHKVLRGSTDNPCRATYNYGPDEKTVEPGHPATGLAAVITFFSGEYSRLRMY